MKKENGMKAESGVALAIAMLFILFFAILTLPFVRQGAMALKHRVKVSDYDRLQVYADSAHEKAVYDIRRDDNTTQRTTWQQGDLTGVIRDQSGAVWPVSGGYAQIIMQDGKIALIKVEGIYE